MYGAFTLFGGAFRLLPLIFNFLTLPGGDSRPVAIKTTLSEYSSKVLFIGHL
jgi:hypothetical protein